jgi:hypothetical protein
MLGQEDLQVLAQWSSGLWSGNSHICTELQSCGHLLEDRRADTVFILLMRNYAVEFNELFWAMQMTIGEDMIWTRYLSSSHLAFLIRSGLSSRAISQMFGSCAEASTLRFWSVELRAGLSICASEMTGEWGACFAENTVLDGTESEWLHCGGNPL